MSMLVSSCSLCMCRHTAKRWLYEFAFETPTIRNSLLLFSLKCLLSFTILHIVSSWWVPNYLSTISYFYFSHWTNWLLVLYMTLVIFAHWCRSKEELICPTGMFKTGMKTEFGMFWKNSESKDYQSLHRSAWDTQSWKILLHLPWIDFFCNSTLFAIFMEASQLSIPYVLHEIAIVLANNLFVLAIMLGIGIVEHPFLDFSHLFSPFVVINWPWFWYSYRLLFSFFFLPFKTFNLFALLSDFFCV